MRDYVRVNRHAYDLTASDYRKRAKHYSNEPLEVLAGSSLSCLPSKENNSILEVGPGSGEVCRYFADLNNDTTAVDISEEIISNVNKISPSTKTIKADILDVKLTPGTYDLVYAEKLVHLFTKADASRVMRKMFKCLKPDGILFINTAIHFKPEQGFARKKKFDTQVKRYRHQYAKSEFKNLIRSSNFRIIDEIKTEADDYGKYWQAYICKRPHAHWWNNLKIRSVDL